MLNCSKRTVERKLHANGLSRKNYTAISDSQLDDRLHSHFLGVVRKLCEADSPHQEFVFRGKLRVRLSIRRVDLAGVNR